MFYVSVTSILREYWLRETNKQLDNYVLRFRNHFLEKRFFKAYFCLNLIKLSPVLFCPPPSALLSFPLEKSIQEVTVSHICLRYYFYAFELTGSIVWQTRTEIRKPISDLMLWLTTLGKPSQFSFLSFKIQWKRIIQSSTLYPISSILSTSFFVSFGNKIHLS